MYKELVNGTFIQQDISYVSLMRRPIKKHPSYLQPLFEAISNALEATNGENDIITIRIKRSKTLLENKLTFNSIEITDTGVGFDDKNFKRLRNIYDESKNCNNLGTGRIQYLHFFGKTDIYSSYNDNGVLRNRRIVLSTDFYSKENSVIWMSDMAESESNNFLGTSITFYFPKSDIDRQKYEELTTEELRRKILLHYLSRFCLNKDHLQTIKIENYINNVHDSESDQVICGSDIPAADYQESFKLEYLLYNKDTKKFERQQERESFQINSYLLPTTIQRKNEIKLTSKDETVEVSGLDLSFIDKSSKIKGKYMLCLVSSTFLTEQDGDLRGKLHLKTKKDFIRQNDAFEISEPHIFIDEIEEHIVSKITTFYPQIRKIKEEYDKELEEIIELFALDRNIIKEVGYKYGENIAAFLKRYKEYNAEVAAKKEARMKSVIDSLKTLDTTANNYRQNFNKKIKELSKLIPQKNRADITNYISSRKAALSILKFILKKQLEVQTNNKISKRQQNEKLIHNLLFTRHSTDPIESNLWILNEDFIHYNGISEGELRNVKIQGESFLREDLTGSELAKLKRYNRDQLGKRTDILLFPQEHKCIIIELKSTEADVTKYLDQVIDYAGLIRQYSKDKFEITNFYAYLIGEDFDFDAVINRNPSFIESDYLDYLYIPDQKINGGKHREKGTMYFEVLKYSSLLERAELRNSAFISPLFK